MGLVDPHVDDDLGIDGVEREGHADAHPLHEDEGRAVREAVLLVGTRLEQGERFQPYEVLLLTAGGDTAVYASVRTAADQ